MRPREREKNGSSRGRTGWVVLLTGILAVAIASVAVTANGWKHDFRVRRLRTEGNIFVPDSDIIRAASVPKNEKLFDVDLNKVRGRVEQNPFMKCVSVTREIPDGIAIIVTERKPLAVLVKDRCLYVDPDGYVLPPVRTAEVIDLPVLTGDMPVAECTPGRQIQSRKIRGALEILATAERIGDDMYHMISEVHCNGDSTYELFTTDGGIPVAFGSGDIALKLVTLDGFWKQIVVQRGAVQLRTVDLRFSDQVVVRWDEGRGTRTQQ